jgi:hypothetical protein
MIRAGLTRVIVAVRARASRVKQRTIQTCPRLLLDTVINDQTYGREAQRYPAFWNGVTDSKKWEKIRRVSGNGPQERNSDDARCAVH